MWNTTVARILQIVGTLLAIAASSFQLTSLNGVEGTQAYLERRSIESKLEHLWNYVTLDSEDKKAKYRGEAQRFFVNSGLAADSHEKEVDRYRRAYSIASIVGASLAFLAFLFEPKNQQNNGPKRVERTQKRRRAAHA